MLAQIIRIASGRRSKTLLRGRPKDLRKFTRSEPDHWALINHARASRDVADIDCLPRLLRSAPTACQVLRLDSSVRTRVHLLSITFRLPSMLQTPFALIVTNYFQ